MSNAYININYSPETCGWCNGSGEDDGSRDRPCRICDGQGSVLVAQPANNCAWCDGKGADRIESDKTCRACDGCGWAHSIINDL